MRSSAVLVVVRAFAVVVTTALLVATIVSAASEHAPATGDGHGGRWGTAVITHCNSGAGECFGDFVSDTGTIRRADVRVWYADEATVGEQVRAFADTEDGDVTHPGASALATNIWGFVLLGLVWLASLAWLLGPMLARRRLRRRF